MKKPVRSLALLSVAALAATGLASMTGSAVASTARAAEPEVLAKHLVGPLSAAVAKDGSVYVSQNFGGNLVHVVPGEKPVVVYQSKEKNAEVGGASVHKKTVTFTLTGKNQMVKQMKNGGKPTNLADVGAWEAKKNPDKVTTYGAQGITDECAAQWPVKEAGPALYSGIVESHPYSTYTTGEGVYLGDAAGNDILWIGNDGKIKTVAVLPPTPATITAEAAEAIGIPECAVGLEYWFEPVPTDVELGPDGWLYVSSLPGGPEDGEPGCPGSRLQGQPQERQGQDGRRRVRQHRRRRRRQQR